MNRYEFEVRYSEAQIRRSTWAYLRIALRRGFGWSGWLAVIVTPVAWGWLALHAPHHWAVWAIPVMLISVTLVLWVCWNTHIKHSLERLSRMKSPVANVVADDDNFAIGSELGSSTMPWTSFTESIDGPGAIYMKAGKGAMINLPIEGVDPRAVQFIRDRIAAHRPKG